MPTVTPELLKSIVLKHTNIGGYPNTKAIAEEAFNLGRAMSEAHPPETVERVADAIDTAILKLPTLKHNTRADALNQDELRIIAKAALKAFGERQP